jgi:cobalt-zinc-cadmium efflux system protein
LAHGDHDHHHDHDHHDEREHDHSHGTPQGQLKFAILFTGLVFLVEAVGGYLTNSLALMSDAAHVFMDVFALGLSLVALYLAAIPASDTRTYGWHRTEVFAAAINGVSLFIISIGIFYEVWERLATPPEIKTAEMMIIAVIGLVANAIVAAKLQAHSHQDLNLHSAFLHVVSDMLASVGVVIGGVIMLLRPKWVVVDAIVGAGIGLLILVGSGRVVRESVHILLEGVPKGIDVNKVAESIRKIYGVKDLHHLHIWSICSNIMALSSHVLLDSAWKGNPEALKETINRALKEEFGISDTTLQFDATPEAHDTLVHNIQHPEEAFFDEE